MWPASHPMISDCPYQMDQVPILQLGELKVTLNPFLQNCSRAPYPLSLRTSTGWEFSRAKKSVASHFVLLAFSASRKS